jgi:tetratricopeptide (TPR) repeat protein
VPDIATAVPDTELNGPGGAGRIKGVRPCATSPARRVLLAAGAVLLLGAGSGGATGTTSGTTSGTTPPPQRRQADPDAIGEVRRSPAAGRFASARAMAHYLTARGKAATGDLAGATEELRLAVAYDDQSPELRSAYAEALATTGKILAAEAEARRSLALSGEGRAATAAHVLLARVHAARKERAPALAELEAAMAVEVARLAAGETPDAEAWRLAAEQHLEAGDPDGALARLDDAVARIGTDGVGFREIGRALLEHHDLARAERALLQAVALSRADQEAWKLLAEVHLGLTRPLEARDDLVQVLRLDPDDGDAQLGLGRIALREDDVAAARQHLARYLAGAGQGWEPYLRIAFEWLDARRPEEALAVARQGLAEPSPGAKLRLVEGLALQELRRWDEAAAALAQVPVGAGDTWFSARAALSYALSRAGRHAEALAALQPAMAARPGEPRLVTARAVVLGRVGRGAEAMEQLQAVLTEREKTGDLPAIDELYPALADMLVRLGKPGDAVLTLERAVAAHPRDEALLYALGAAYERDNRPEEAVAQMRALLVLAPDHAEALNFVGFTWAEKGIKLDEAEGLVRRALKLSPRAGHMVDSLGFIRLKRGDARQAVELLEEADRLIGPDPSVLDHLGDAYRAATRPADAVAAWRRALKNVGEESPAEQLELRASLERKLKDLGAAAERRPVAK